MEIEILPIILLSVYYNIRQNAINITHTYVLSKHSEHIFVKNMFEKAKFHFQE